MHHRVVVRLAVVACLASISALPVAADAPSALTPASVAAQIHDVIEQSPGRGVAGEPVASADLRRVYAAFGDAPLWQLEPGADARRQALEAAISTAAAHGIPPDDLHLGVLPALAHPTTARSAAERDVLLTDSLLRYARKLRQGAVDPEALGADWHIAAEPFDPVKAVTEAVRTGRFTDFLHALPPADPQYGWLVAGLQSYRMMAGHGGWTSVPGRDEVKLDGRDPRVAALRNRLMAEGYLPAGAGALDVGHLALAVRSFQARHGLDADARVGAKTLAALNVGAEERADQIAANLERWRHVPRQPGPRYIAVNLADASLDLIENGVSVFHTRVIVGDARHQSPNIRATVTGVTFNPPWKVPPSIAVREMLPKLKRDPGYLARNDIVIVGRSGDDPFGQHVNWRAISAGNFPFRLQQRPGLKNSLGSLKLEMANPWNVYLHDTPAKALFERSQRGFSHGCIRVQQPGELVRRLLDDPAWDADAIADGVASGVTRTVPLHRAVPVYLLYWTAFADADGAVNFRDDIYGRDPPIARALDLPPARSNANELQRAASCSEPSAGLSLQLDG